MSTPRIIVIGGGHNGLVTAFYLAKAGLKPLVLERRSQVGGAAITEEFYPGFRISTLAHSAGPLRPDIVRDLQLEKHGLKFITPDAAVTSLSSDNRALALYRDIERSSESISTFSQRDARHYRRFAAALAKVSHVIAKALALMPPEIESGTTRSAELASARPLSSRLGKARYLQPAALGADARGRFGRGILRN